MPIGTNMGLVGIALLSRDPVAIALTGVASVVTTAAIVVHARTAAADQERIAYLQAALPRLRTAADAEGVLNLAPKPSTMMGEVLRQHRPAMSPGAATLRSMPLVDVESIDPT